MFFEIVRGVMKAPHSSFILPALLWASVAVAAETPTDLESRAAEQERQIRQLEVQNQRLRDQIERLQEQLAAKEDTLPPLAPDSPTPPTPPTADPEPPVPPADEASAPVHIVRAGESLSRIAKQHGTTTEVLAELNGIRNPSLIREGQRLKLPAADAPGSLPTPAGDTGVVTGTHTVKAGETFFSIAKLYGLNVDALQAANPDVNPTALRIGQELKLTAKQAPDPAEPSQPDTAAPDDSEANASNKKVIRRIPINEQISFGEFAKQHQMEPAKLNALNGLDLETTTILDTGSLLYVSAQPLE